jgi:hypothetical protein
MANRFPLVINNTTTVVGELQSGDALNLSLSGIYDGSSTGSNTQYLKATGDGKVTWAAPGDVYLTTAQTLQNKTFSSCIFNATSNTLTNVPNGSLVNSSITINGTAISLGGSVVTPDLNTTYTIGTTQPSTNYALIRLTAGGSGTLTNSEFNLYGQQGITVQRQTNGDIRLAPALQALAPNATTGYITGSSYDGLTARTWDINATTTNTGNAIVARDVNGDFAARNITAVKFIVSGSSSSAFLKGDGTTDTNAYITSASVGTGTLTLATSGSGISGSASFGANSSSNVTFTVSSSATNANTANSIVFRDASGNFSAGTISASLSGSASQLNGLSSGYSGANVVLRTDGNGYLLLDNWVRVANGSGMYTATNGSYVYNDTTYGWFMRSPSNSSASMRLQTNDGTSRGWFYADNSNQQGFLSTGGGWNLRVDNSGNVYATNDVTAFASDMRLKTNIKPISNALNKVCKLKGFTYEFNELAVSLGFESGKRFSGVSAQEVQEVLPEAVKPAPVSEEYLTVQYEKLVPLLIEAIKDLSERLYKLENK